MNIPSDTVFEFVTFANQLNVMKSNVGKGFTIESKERGKKLTEYITKKLMKLKNKFFII